MLAIAWQYLTGQAVATDPTDRQQAEWPPHPDRVLQAMVAAWGANGCRPEGRVALDWLMSLSPPEIACPLDADRAAVVKVFVPVNDIVGPKERTYSDAHLKLLPDRRLRKERFFPAVNVGAETCALIWPDVDPASHSDVLREVCAHTTSIGHSRSLVRMWLCDRPPPTTLRPGNARNDYRLRISGAGRMAELIDAFAAGGPGWRRPPTARWMTYERTTGHADVARGEFDDRLIVFRRSGGTWLGLSDAPMAIAAMRKLLIAAAEPFPVAKRLISGHEPDGAPLRDTHVAILPLAFVGESGTTGGGRFADGHLLGLGLALPRDLAADAEQELLLVVATAFRGSDNGTRQLTFGARGVMEIAPDTLDAPPGALRASTWVRTSNLWGSVTPVALDRLPPRRYEDPDLWAAAQISDACRRQGLPLPIDIELLPVSPWIGSPPGHAFPALQRKDGTRRWHTHVRIRFSDPVPGPIVLGAGRYRGYGLLRPMGRRS